MNLDEIFCGDIETNGLMDTVSKIHVFSFGYKKDNEWKVGSTPRPEDIKKFFINPENVIAIHNGQRFDAPAIEKVLGIKVKAVVIDTLALAWYVDFGRPWNQYNLEWYGESFGVPKPVVTDWVGLSYEAYAHRCSEDVKITIKLWEKLLEKLRLIYDSDQDIIRVIKYLNFIMECSYKQEEQKIEIDIEKVKSNLAYFESLKEAKVSQLKDAMPKIPIVKTIKKPVDMYLKSGKGLSVAGKKWLEYTSAGESGSYPEDVVEITITTGHAEPNPNSVPQKKAWLYSLGWKPQTFKYDRNKETRKVRKIEQILTEEKLLCPSVLKLAEKDPAIGVLDSLSVLTHRIGLFKSLLDNHTDGFIVQGLTQLAVSLRWQHSVIVNLPKYTGKGDLRDGIWIRECLIAGEGNKLVQADLSGIESRTSDHYTFPLNPDLIKETQQPFFDPHLKIAVVSNLMTEDEAIWFKWKKENKERKEKGLSDLPVEVFGSLSSTFSVGNEKDLMDRLKASRHKAKTTNYSSLYGVTPPTLARTLGILEKEAQKLIQGYWTVHWAVKDVTKTFNIKTVGDELWILNPISRFRHHLRNEKDAFSTVNQSSATYCFNIWVWNITNTGIWPISNGHDDTLLRCNEGEEEKVKKIVIKAMEQTNRQLKLNIKLDCEVQVGDNLSETH